MASEIVVDCSACGGWYIQDETTSASLAVLDDLLSEQLRLVVPDLWWYETLNLLRSAGLRGRITAADARKAVYFLTELPLETVSVERIGHLRILELAQQHNLSAYDATYLALAEARGVKLLTADRHLLGLRAQFDWILPLGSSSTHP